MTIGKRIKSERNKKGMTQVQLADAANISRSYLGDLEGDRYNPSLDTLQKIAAALGTTSGVLLGDASILELTAADNDMKDAMSLLEAQRSAQAEAEKNAPALTKKDERDIGRDLERIMADLEGSGDLMFDGVPMSQEAIDSLKSAMKLGLEAVKLRNKETYTPKKYRRPKEE